MILFQLFLFKQCLKEREQNSQWVSVSDPLGYGLDLVCKHISRWIAWRQPGTKEVLLHGWTPVLTIVAIVVATVVVEVVKEVIVKAVVEAVVEGVVEGVVKVVHAIFRCCWQCCSVLQAASYLTLLLPGFSQFIAQSPKL